jgi:GNAT superfamily N-acetyltransferase
MPSAEVWVAEVDETVTGVLVLNGNWIEQLYVDPDWTNQGLGTALVERAKAERPAALDLWTFKSNRGAQRFYQRHGFRAVGGTNGDNEEGEPDIHYRWVK